MDWVSGPLHDLCRDLPVVTREADPRVLGPVAEAWPEERDAMVRAVAKRRYEYFASRHLARLGFQELGLEPVAVLNNADRSPCWPQGVIGSLSHTDGWCGVALARVGQGLKSIGIDAERFGSMSTAVAERILTVSEYQSVRQSGQPLLTATAHFSAKESVYKALYPHCKRFIGFSEVEIELEPATQRFEARLVSDQLKLEVCPGRPLTGHYRMLPDLCITVVAYS